MPIEDGSVASMRRWCLIYGLATAAVLLWLCTISLPASYEFDATTRRWYYHESTLSAAGVYARAGLALLAGYLLYHGRNPDEQTSEPIQIQADPPRWVHNLPAPSGFDLFSLGAIVLGGGVALGLCRLLPAVDFGLLITGRSMRRRDHRGELEVNHRGELEVTYDPTDEIIQLRLFVVLILIMAGIAALYWHHWRNNRLMQNQRDSKLITID